MAEDRRMRIADEFAHAARMPVVAPGRVAGGVHLLLHDEPLPGFVNHEGMQVELKAVGNGVVVHASGQSRKIRMVFIAATLVAA